MKMIFLSLLAGLMGCQEYTNLSVDEFQKMIANDHAVQLVDVRTPQEYAEGHLACAMNIDWHSNDFMQQVEASLVKDRPVMVYCRSGKRSAAAAEKLAAAGYKTYNMLGGYLAWTEAGKNTIRTEP